MTLSLDVELSPEEAAEIRGTDPRWWFTQFRFANAESPRHPSFARLEANNEFKRSLVLDWVERLAPGARVLDTFCANGAFSFEAARLGASRAVLRPPAASRPRRRRCPPDRSCQYPSRRPGSYRNAA